MDHESKTLDLQLKSDSDDGAFSATFSTFNVVDHHGDVTLAGALEPGKEVLIGAYMHDLRGLPVGKGVIHADDTRAWVEGKFFTDTPDGLATYQTVKNAGGLMEWSYVFRVTESDYGEFDTGKGTVDVRFLKKLDVWSVDPVLKGAGIGTRTDSIKSTPQPFIEQADELVAAVDLFAKRVESRVEMRAKDGRRLSADDRERITALVTGLGELKQRLEEAAKADPEGKQAIDLQHEFLKFQRASAVLSGVTA